jgi:hypothetical protein
MNPNDEIRRLILQWFYDRNSNAESQYGKAGSAATISVVKRALKQAHGLAQQQVMSNLVYLIDKEWIKESQIEKMVTTKGGSSVPSIQRWFQISSEGIDRIEGESDLKHTDRYAGINISALGTNIITLGDGNLVAAEFSALHRELGFLKEVVARAAALDEAEKLDVSVDIETIRNQLAKAKPDRAVITNLWQRIRDIAAVSGFADAVAKVAPLMAELLS